MEGIIGMQVVQGGGVDLHPGGHAKRRAHQIVAQVGDRNQHHLIFERRPRVARFGTQGGGD